MKIQLQPFSFTFLTLIVFFFSRKMRELTLYVETGLKLISDGWRGGVQKRKWDPTKNPKISKRAWGTITCNWRVVFLELDAHRRHLDFKILDENNNEIIPRTFQLTSPTIK